MVTMPEDSVVVGCAGPGNGKRCPARLAMTRDELRGLNDEGGSVRCPGCERKRKEGERKRKAGGRTAADIVLLAAADLSAAGNTEFTEWDLAVAAWSLDRTRFGMRGYEQIYPDHKRVYMEIVGGKPSSPVRLSYVEKLRPNTYRITPLGWAAADRLRAKGAA